MTTRLTRAERERLTDEVLAELQAGNWPTCTSCGGHRINYIGLVSDAPTFHCYDCWTFWAADLTDA